MTNPSQEQTKVEEQQTVDAASNVPTQEVVAPEAAPVADSKQPDAANNDKPVVDDASAQVEQAVEAKEDDKAPTEPVEEKEQQKDDQVVSESQPDTVESESDRKKTLADDGVDKVVEKSEEVKEETNGSATNGDAKEKTNEPVVEETNGNVCKRKVTDEAPVAGDEKSPKKAKVVDGEEQVPVEETAA